MKSIRHRIYDIYYKAIAECGTYATRQMTFYVSPDIYEELWRDRLAVTDISEASLLGLPLKVDRTLNQSNIRLRLEVTER